MPIEIENRIPFLKSHTNPLLEKGEEDWIFYISIGII